MNSTAKGFMIGIAVGIFAYHIYAQTATAKRPTA